MKLLLDTDIGSDIDDAVCLAYLLMQPDCNLLGITTVTGQAHRRAAMASAICRCAGQDIPIIPGSENPLIVEQRQPMAQQSVRLSNWPHDEEFMETPAVSFLAETILAHPGEVTLLTIGPLTNIALLFVIYPDVIPALRRLVVMGGKFFQMSKGSMIVEWNIFLDPHAARIVYGTPIPIHQSIGLDVTHQVRLPAESIKQEFRHPILQPVLDFAEVWFDQNDFLVFHDPLAAVSIFNSKVCQFKSGVVDVNLDPRAGPLGLTTLSKVAGQGPHQVASDVDTHHFFTSFFKVFT